MKRLRLALLVLLSLSGAVAAQDPPRRELDGEDAIRERARLYLQRHGEHGRIDPEQRRRAVTQAYGAWRAEESLRARTPLIGGTAWSSLGPANGAGRATAIVPLATAGQLLV